MKVSRLVFALASACLFAASFSACAGLKPGESAVYGKLVGEWTVVSKPSAWPDIEYDFGGDGTMKIIYQKAGSTFTGYEGDVGSVSDNAMKVSCTKSSDPLKIGTTMSLRFEFTADDQIKIGWKDDAANSLKWYLGLTRK
jgi:hypothetical protein